MKRILVMIVLCASAMQLLAQTWDIHVATGSSFARLIPVLQSSPQTAIVRYSFTKPGIYLSPELGITIDEHNRFTIGYQFSDNKAGVKFLTASRSAKEIDYDIIDLHNFSVGYSFQQIIFHNQVKVGGFAKMGLAFGYMDGFGASGTAGGVDGYSGYAAAGSRRLTGFEVMSDFWTPTSTIGFSVGPNSKNKKLADRLSFDISATACFKNPYKAYSKIFYTIADNQTQQSGVAQYQGIPFLMQFGVNYRLFRLGNDTLKRTRSRGQAKQGGKKQ